MNNLTETEMLAYEAGKKMERNRIRESLSKTLWHLSDGQLQPIDISKILEPETVNPWPEDLTADNLRKQLMGFLNSCPFPKSKDAVKAKQQAEFLIAFIEDTFELEKKK